MELTIDLSISTDSPVYAGVDITQAGGRANITTEPQAAADRIGAAVNAIVHDTPPQERHTIVLTGAAPIWAYAVAIHAALHACTRLYTDDGRGHRVLVAAHGA